MSVLIKGMEIVEHCMDCPFMVSRDGDDCILQSAEANESFESWEDMRKGCPLISVPPHGRLIDADALMLKILDYIEEYSDVDDKGWHNLKWCAMKEAEMAIEDAPTIIPASEEHTMEEFMYGQDGNPNDGSM